MITNIPVYAYPDGRQIIHMQYTPEKGWYDVIDGSRLPGGAPHAFIAVHIPEPSPTQVHGTFVREEIEEAQP